MRKTASGTHDFTWNSHHTRNASLFPPEWGTRVGDHALEGGAQINLKPPGKVGGGNIPHQPDRRLHLLICLRLSPDTAFPVCKSSGRGSRPKKASTLLECHDEILCVYASPPFVRKRKSGHCRHRLFAVIIIPRGRTRQARAICSICSLPPPHHTLLPCEPQWIG